MSDLCRYPSARSALLVGVVLGMGASPAWPQAWTPFQGEGSVALLYNSTDIHRHLFSNDSLDGQDVEPGAGAIIEGDSVDAGHITGESFMLAFEYGLTDRLAVSGDVAFVMSAYEGPIPESDGDLEGGEKAFQDFSLGLRYAALLEPLVVTPFVRYGRPTHGYEVVGHSAVGLGLNYLQLGVHLGRALDPWLEQCYAHVSYSYAIVENVEEWGVDRSNLSVELGYFITDSVGVRVVGDFLWTHDGFDWTDLEAFETHLHVHDQAARATSTAIGGGLFYAINDRFDLNFGYMAVVTGGNTHDARGPIVVLNWNF